MAVYMLDRSTIIVQMYRINSLATKPFTRTKISKNILKTIQNEPTAQKLQILLHILGLQPEQLY